MVRRQEMGWREAGEKYKVRGKAKGEGRELLGEQAEKTVKAQRHRPDMAICASTTKLQQLSAGMASIFFIF